MPQINMNRKAISEAQRNRVFDRDGNKCTYIDETTGERCNSEYDLQVDHIVPFANGGKTEDSNLRTVCRTHNLLGRSNNLPPKVDKENSNKRVFHPYHPFKVGPGQPRICATPEILEERIDAYFNHCEKHQQYPTIAGLALACGYNHRSELAQIANAKPEYSNAITRARSRIESYRVGIMVDPDTKNTRGAIFDLVNNHGYRSDSDVRVESVSWSIERGAPPALVGKEAKELPAPQAVVVEGTSSLVQEVDRVET